MTCARTSDCLTLPHLQNDASSSITTAIVRVVLVAVVLVVAAVIVVATATVLRQTWPGSPKVDRVRNVECRNGLECKRVVAGEE